MSHSQYIEIDEALPPLLHAAGRAPLQHLLREVKEGLHAYAGLRKHHKRSRVHVRWSAAEASRLASRAKSAGSEGIGWRGAVRRTAYVDK